MMLKIYYSPIRYLMALELLLFYISPHDDERKKQLRRKLIVKYLPLKEKNDGKTVVNFIEY